VGFATPTWLFEQLSSLSSKPTEVVRERGECLAMLKCCGSQIARHITLLSLGNKALRGRQTNPAGAAGDEGRLPARRFMLPAPNRTKVIG